MDIEKLYPRIKSHLFSESEIEPLVVPDYEVIRRETTNPNSSLAFQELLKKFRNGTISTDECRYLYYGYLDTPKSLEEYRCADKFLVSEEQMALATPKQATIYLKNAQQEWENYPFDLHLIELMSQAAFRADEPTLGLTYASQLNALLSVILSSGYGITDFPFHVIRIKDEYDLLRVLQTEPIARQTFDGAVDALTLQNKKTILFYIKKIKPTQNHSII